MPRNLEATTARARHCWRNRGSVYVSFPTLARAFRALERLAYQGHTVEYDGHAGGRHWIVFAEWPVTA